MSSSQISGTLTPTPERDLTGTALGPAPSMHVLKDPPPTPPTTRDRFTRRSCIFARPRYRLSRHVTLRSTATKEERQRYQQSIVARGLKTIYKLALKRQPPSKMAVDAEDLIIQPFQELVERANDAIKNAEEGSGADPERSKQMLKAAQNVVKEGDRALQKIQPLWLGQVEKHGDAFREAISENGMHE